MDQSPRKRRILALWFPWFAAERVARRHPALKGRPFVMAEEKNGRRVIAATSRLAEEAGFEAGTPIADARAIQPDLPVFDTRREADARALRQLALWALRYTPHAGTGQDHTLLLDIAGCTHFHGGETGLAWDALRRLKEFGFEGLAGIDDTPGGAWAMAHHGPAEQRIGILPPLSTPAARQDLLAHLPLTALRLDDEAALALANFGLRHLGDLYEIARSDLASRFGETLLMRLDQILGREDEPISPVQEPPEFQVAEAFPEPLTNLAAMEQVLARLLERMCHILAREGRGAGRLVFSGFGADGRVVDVAAGASRPGRDPRVWARLFHEKLPWLNRDVGYDFMQLSALATAPLSTGQTDWQGRKPDMAALSPLIDRLGNRFGFDKLQRQAVVTSWWPERAVTRRPVFDRPAALTWPLERPRPLRLLRCPIAISATAPVPDDPPLFFRWQGRVHRIRAADGPERLMPEWWHADGGEEEARDYYRVEDETGQRFWLYREGLYEPGRPPRWFLHGIFP